MTLNELMEHVVSAYPLETIDCYWNGTEIIDNEEGGDTLALFALREVADTYDETQPDKQQLVEAAVCITRAAKDLTDTARALQRKCTECK